MTPKEKEKKSENATKQEEKEIKGEESDSEKKSSKFKFQCTKCGQCCQNREPIPVTFSDLARWTKQGSFMSIILPHLELQSVSEKDDLSKIALIPYIKMKETDDNGRGICPFYDPDNKICNIYFTIPIFCKTFPLSYNGQNFYVSDPSCPGLGQEGMTKEHLTEMREIAIRDYNERANTTLAMIPLQGLFIRHFMDQSQKTIDRLSDDEKKQLDELIQKTQKEKSEKEKNEKVKQADD